MSLRDADFFCAVSASGIRVGAYNGIGHGLCIAASAVLRACRGIFRFSVCMKVFGTGNTFSAEQCTVDRQRFHCFGIAEKNQECEFPCRSDAVIFFMPI